MRMTEEYKNLQKELHSRGNYGVGVHVLECCHIVKATTPPGETVLDYGCGQGKLKHYLPSTYQVSEYDPAIEGKDGEPDPAFTVVCADVLEHIEPECLDNVLEHLRSVTREYAVLIIATCAAGKVLSDGRNAHLIIETSSWWVQKVGQFFDIMQSGNSAGGVRAVTIVCQPKAL